MVVAVTIHTSARKSENCERCVVSHASFVCIVNCLCILNDACWWMDTQWQNEQQFICVHFFLFPFQYLLFGTHVQKKGLESENGKEKTTENSNNNNRTNTYVTAHHTMACIQENREAMPNGNNEIFKCVIFTYRYRYTYIMYYIFIVLLKPNHFYEFLDFCEHIH